MAPVATDEKVQDNASTGPLKKVAEKLFNPFYSPTIEDNGNDADYKFAKYKVRILN